MGFAYFPHTDEDIRLMLERVGAGRLEDLYSDVPADVMYGKVFQRPGFAQQ